LLVTEVLRTVVAVNSGGIQLVFCGGTCLSKAHGLIERMSEDIDFKLVLPQGVSRSARSRVLSRYKRRLWLKCWSQQVLWYLRIRSSPVTRTATFR